MRRSTHSLLRVQIAGIVFAQIVIPLACCSTSHAQTSSTALGWPKPASVRLLINEGQLSAIGRYVNGKPVNVATGFPGRLVLAFDQCLGDRHIPELATGQLLTLTFHVPPLEEGHYLLSGTLTADGPIWEAAMPVTAEVVDYFLNAPGRLRPVEEQLAYAVRFLEHAEPLIAADAYAECARASYADLAGIADQLDPDALQRWIKEARTGEELSRTGLYGYLLGLCGQRKHAQFLRYAVVRRTEHYKLGIEGLVTGYLLLDGEPGLSILERHFLQQDPAVRYHHFAPVLSFFWERPEASPLSRDRLRQALHPLLTSPETAELVIRDLIEWEDVAAVDDVAKLFFDPEFDDPVIRQWVVTYLRKVANAAVQNPLAAAAAAKASIYLLEIRAQDPDALNVEL